MVRKVGNMQRGAMFDDSPQGILELLLVVGGIAAGMAIAPTLLVALGGLGYAVRESERRKINKKVSTSFSYLKKRGEIHAATNAGGSKMYIVSPKGKQRVNRARLERSIANAKSARAWDGMWRLILFDIVAEERAKRDAFRGLVRRLGAVMLQKSVWAYPFDCSEQVSLLQDFFGLSDREIRLVVAKTLGDDTGLRKRFRL